MIIYTFEDLNPHAVGVLFISFKGNVADKWHVFFNRKGCIHQP